MDYLSLASGLALVLMIAALSVVALRLKLSSPLLMLAAGMALAFVPGMPSWTLDPDLIFLGLLPPLLYTSGVNMSWRGFRSNLRPILALAIGCVLFTATAVAVVGHYLLGLPWVIGFLLGSIVSPPDAVAPIAIMRTLSLPRSLTTVLQGESLINDATALVIFGFALTAIATGSFSLAAAAGKFVVVVCGEVGFGLARRLGHAASSRSRVRRARGSAAGPGDALHRVLAAAGAGRFRRRRLRGRGALGFMEWPALDSSGDATARLFHLGPGDVDRRGAPLPAHGSAGARRGRPTDWASPGAAP